MLLSIMGNKDRIALRKLRDTQNRLRGQGGRQGIKNKKVTLSDIRKEFDDKIDNLRKEMIADVRKVQATANGNMAAIEQKDVALQDLIVKMSQMDQILQSQGKIIGDILNVMDLDEEEVEEAPEGENKNEVDPEEITEEVIEEEPLEEEQEEAKPAKQQKKTKKQKKKTKAKKKKKKTEE